MKNRIIPFTVTTIAFCMIFVMAACSSSPQKTVTGKDAATILSNLTTEEKVGQMLQPAVYNINSADMKNYHFGSLLSYSPDMDQTQEGWASTVSGWQDVALHSNGIPYIFGNDAVHGVNVCTDAVIFPHNIGIGAANNLALTYKMGAAVADELKLTGMLWNFSPCLAVASDPRWGRTYESYSSNPQIVSQLGEAYTKGQLENGVIPTAKHYIGDGSVTYGTGEDGNLIDRGDASLDDTKLDALLNVYRVQIAAGVPTIMISHSSVNGIKMHAHKELITDVLKGELGFKGVVISDWESIHHIPGSSYEQVVHSVNAGIDMFMEADSYATTYDNLLKAIDNGDVSMDRINDAVLRILTLKENYGLFEDPYLTTVKSNDLEMGSAACRDIARQLVEESLVLLKNDNNILPIKKGTSIYVTGPAADDTGVQCGGWTFQWQGGQDDDEKYVATATTILEGLINIADEYDITVITDPQKADSADFTLLCIGEKPYAEWEGDTSDLSITGALALAENKSAIEEAKKLGKPTITLLIAGRNVIYDAYEADWDSIVMCYLPGSEADGIANVLTGKRVFKGKLAMPYYHTTSDIEKDVFKYEVGYGLNY